MLQKGWTVSLSQLFLAVTGLFIFALLVNLGFNVFPAVERLVDARANRAAVARYEAIFRAADSFSAERVPANVLMAIPPRSDIAAAGRLSEARYRADAALDDALSRPDERFAEWSAEVNRVRWALADARALVDAVIARPWQERTSRMTIEANAAMMVAFDRLQPIIDRQKLALLRTDGSLSGPLGLAHAASDLREFAGRLGALVMPFLAKGEPISDDRFQLIQETRGRILQLLRFMPREEADDPGESVSLALRDAERIYVGTGLKLIADLTRQGRLGLPYSIAARDLPELYAPTMEPLERLRELVVAAMVDEFEVRQAVAREALIVQVAGATVATLAVFVLLFLLRRLSVQPLLAARQRIIDLSQDRFGLTPQSAGHVAELSSLYAALGVLHERLVERHALIAELRLRTEIDPLTGLMSRTHFEACAEAAVDAARSEDFGILYVDIDHFKTVNDTLGHQVGDALIAEIGRRLAQFSTERTFVGRVGGDEFAVCCTEAAAPEREALAQAIIRAVGAIGTIEGHPLSVSTSIGLSAEGPGRGRYRELCRQADVALYVSKASGRSMATWYRPYQPVRGAEAAAEPLPLRPLAERFVSRTPAARLERCG